MKATWLPSCLKGRLWFQISSFEEESIAKERYLMVLARQQLHDSKLSSSDMLLGDVSHG
jgi:hypothetical protein